MASLPETAQGNKIRMEQVVTVMGNGSAKEATDVDADRSEEEAIPVLLFPMTPNVRDRRKEAKIRNDVGVPL